MKFSVCSMVAITMLLSVVCSQSVAQDKPARTDLHGDPLPAGAIARFGTIRLQHAGQIVGLVYSPDGKWLASAGADKVIRIWDAETGKAIHTLEGHTMSLRCLAFVSAGEGKPAQMLVSGGFDKTIRFWDLKTGKELPKVINHSGAVSALAVSADGKFLASGGIADGQIFLWQVEDGKEVRRWQAHQGGALGLAFAPDGKSIVSGGMARRDVFLRKGDDPEDDYAVAVWETDTGKLRHKLAGQNSNVWAIALSSDGKRLASTGIDKTAGRSVILWDPDTGKQLRAIGDRFGGLDSRTLALTRDGKTVATGGFGGIALHDTDGGAEQRGLPNVVTDQIQALAFSPDGRTLASAGKEGRITLWDVATRTAKLADQGHTQPLTAVAVAPDGKTIATTSHDGTAVLWDRATSKPLHRLNQEKARGVAVIWSAAFSPDSRTVALSHQRDGITFWDVDTGKLQREIKEKNFDRIVSVAYSPDGKWVASESIDQPHASLWDANTGESVRIFQRGTKRFTDRGTSVAISPDGRLLASAASNGIHVWELNSGKAIFQKPKGASHAVAFSPGGFLLATAGFGVKILDGTTGAELVKYDGLEFSNQKGIAFSPDGRLLAVADTKGVKLWDVVGRRELRGFNGHRGAVNSVAFTPDGKALVSGGADGTALVWDLDGVLPAEKIDDPQTQWAELTNADRLRVYAAFCRLRASPDDALALLKKQLQPTGSVAAERLAELLKKLESEVFKVHDEAYEELEKLGFGAEKTLRQARRNRPTAETARRLDMLLAQLETGPDWQRALIGFKLLEQLPAGPARALLQDLVKGDPESRLAREADAVLQRILKRGNEER